MKNLRSVIFIFLIILYKNQFLFGQENFNDTLYYNIDFDNKLSSLTKKYNNWSGILKNDSTIVLVKGLHEDWNNVTNFYSDKKNDIDTIEIPAFVYSKELVKYDVSELYSFLEREYLEVDYYYDEDLKIWSFQEACSNGPKVIKIPKTIKKIHSYAFIDFPILTKIIVDKDNPNYISIDGNLYTKDTTELVAYATGKQQNKFEVLPTIRKIHKYAFSNGQLTSEEGINFDDYKKYLSRQVETLIINNFDVDFESKCFYFGQMEGNCPKVLTNNPKYKQSDEIIYYPKNNEILYAQKKLVGDYEIPLTIHRIHNRAFAECKDLQSINLESIIEIGDFAFKNCSSLSEVILSPITKKIGKGCFMNCGELNSVMLYGNIDTIPDSCFLNSNIKKLRLPNNVEYIGKYSFYNGEYKNITLSKKLKYIGDYAFKENLKVKSLSSIPPKLGCCALKNIEQLIVPKGSKELYGKEWGVSLDRIKELNSKKY